MLSYYLTLLYRSPNKDAKLKIADFRLATIMEPGMPETLRYGSPGYVASEMLNNFGYGTKAGVFSAGILLCVMLTGVLPFQGKTCQEVLLRNKECNISTSGNHRSFVSKEAKSLIAKMVAKDPENRCTASESLKYPCFSLEHAVLNNLFNAQENMKKYQSKNRFNAEMWEK